MAFPIVPVAMAAASLISAFKKNKSSAGASGYTPYAPYQGSSGTVDDPMATLERARRLLGAYEVSSHRSSLYDY